MDSAAAAGFEWAEGGGGAVRVGWRSVEGGGAAVGALVLSQPAKRNAWSAAMWRDWAWAVGQLEAQADIHAVVLCAEGPAFTAGLDLGYLADTFARNTAPGTCPARARLQFGEGIRAMQAAFSVLERQRWPVIAAVQGPCVGAGVDLVTACDLRYATTDAVFCVKEVDVGIAADLGTLQRLPAIVGQGAAAEMALTGRNVSADEAAALGLVARVFPTKQQMMAHALEVAADIARKSPLAVYGTKRVLLHTRDGFGGGGAAAGLDFVATWNSAFLLSDDIAEILRARAAKRPPRFSKL